ncbi:MAG: COX15/CtaA family protein [Lutibacter sp.]|nr:COX15/CtaA family protein [Lutibacter sp.]
MTSTYKYTPIVRAWLLTGLLMLIGQVVLGGITRLTGSGLSITTWDIITGVVPPLNAEQWMAAFELYKETPQFQKINADFSLSDFKFIYFWEYFHRLWVRLLGLIFLIPFVLFNLRKQLDTTLNRHLVLVVLLTLLTASAGWIMVKSGLVDRPWVDAYKLTLHFVLALLVIAAMVRTISQAYNLGTPLTVSRTPLLVVLWLLLVQMVFAGLMAGMKSGLFYPTWPDMNGELLPAVLRDSANWNWNNMMNYDHFLFAPALIQFAHRILAYILLGLTLYIFFVYIKRLASFARKCLIASLVLVLLQVLLGILTVLNVRGMIPLALGVGHQLVGLLYFISLFFLYDSLKKRP